MADITGALYESFVGYLLRRLGYRDEWTDGEGRQFLFGRHAEAQCHRGKAGCAYATECSDLSNREKLKHGPWYDPDFFILDGTTPAACIHITHWSNPRSSQYKFWRTMEDHLQYKTLYGRSFISINALFVALDAGEPPRRIVDTEEKLELHGWSPANGSTLAVSFDSSLLFPIDYEPLTAVVPYLPERRPASARRKRELWQAAFVNTIATNPSLEKKIDQAMQLLKACLETQPHPRYPAKAIGALQARCWIGRQSAGGLTQTHSYYRKGVQHAFLLSEIVSSTAQGSLTPQNVLASVVNSQPRFLARDLSRVLGLGPRTTSPPIDEILATIPVRIHKGVTIPLLNRSAGAGHYDWDPDLKQFVLAVRALPELARASLLESIAVLFAAYRKAYGMSYVLADLTEAARIRAKTQYVREHLLVSRSKREFIAAFVASMGANGKPPYADSVADCHNWPAELLLEAYDLGSMQHLTTSLPAAFKTATGESLRPYAYMGNLASLVSHLIGGAKVSSYFSRRASLSESQFLQTIWPIFAECLWTAIAGREAATDAVIESRYRYKKAMRIISSPDLEPVSFLLRRAFPTLAAGPVLRGVFNQLSRAKGWSRAALTTATTGQDPDSSAIIHTQSVFGEKHIADKTKELSARMRANYLRLVEDEMFGPEPTPREHYLVVDGDWPVDAKINLLEAGFSGIFELGDLTLLRGELARKGSPRKRAGP